MGYRFDVNLLFLKKMKSEDLNDLVSCLTLDKKGEPRLTEDLTESDEYKKYFPDHQKYWKLIAAEIQCFGANTIATMFRGGEGVLYEEILIDVCNKLKVVQYEYEDEDEDKAEDENEDVDENEDENKDILDIENSLLEHIFKDIVNKMEPEDLVDLASSMGYENINKVTPAIVIGLCQKAFLLGGFNSYICTVVIANIVMKGLVGTGLSFASNAALTKGMSILVGPVGWAASGIWATIDIASPANRVTIPTVIHIAVLRKKYLYDLQNKKTISTAGVEIGIRNGAATMLVTALTGGVSIGYLIGNGSLTTDGLGILGIVVLVGGIFLVAGAVGYGVYKFLTKKK